MLLVLYVYAYDGVISIFGEVITQISQLSRDVEQDKYKAALNSKPNKDQPTVALGQYMLNELSKVKGDPILPYLISLNQALGNINAFLGVAAPPSLRSHSLPESAMEEVPDELTEVQLQEMHNFFHRVLPLKNRSKAPDFLKTIDIFLNLYRNRKAIVDQYMTDPEAKNDPYYLPSTMPKEAQSILLESMGTERRKGREGALYLLLWKKIVRQ